MREPVIWILLAFGIKADKKMKEEPLLHFTCRFGPRVHKNIEFGTA